MPDNTPFALTATFGLLCALILATLPWFERRGAAALRTTQLALVVLAIVACTGGAACALPKLFQATWIS